MSYQLSLIGGTLVHYYVTCKREAWLYSRHIYADQLDENIAMGRALSEIKEKNFNNFLFSNIKFDKIGKQKGHYLITEYKKTLKNPEGAKAQLLFYMYILKNSLNLKQINGKIITGKEVIFVEGNEENMKKMENLLNEMAIFLEQESPPPFKKIKFCKLCGYKNYCY